MLRFSLYHANRSRRPSAAISASKAASSATPPGSDRPGSDRPMPWPPTTRPAAQRSRIARAPDAGSKRRGRAAPEAKS
jgi:hypothetical protein